MTPTARTLAEGRKRGWTVQVVEHYNRWARKKLDLFGCIDIVAMDPGVGMVNARIIGIQCTTGAHHADRSAKIAEEPRMRLWLEAGGKLEVWRGGEQGARGERKRGEVKVEGGKG